MSTLQKGAALYGIFALLWVARWAKGKYLEVRHEMQRREAAEDGRSSIVVTVIHPSIVPDAGRRADTGVSRANPWGLWN